LWSAVNNTELFQRCCTKTPLLGKHTQQAKQTCTHWVTLSLGSVRACEGCWI